MKALIAIWLVIGAITVAAQSPSWKAATAGRPIVLPADHASHPDYKFEWWYYTGNLESSERERFGYQLTFFRIGVDAERRGASAWAVGDLYITHLAISDVNGRRYQFADRLNRSGPGWAGAATDAYRVWNEDWRATLDGTTHRLEAAQPGLGLALDLEETRPAVLHGLAGYSRKGAAETNASHYYSLTRMPTRGTVTVAGRRVAVTGLSWMDHEFGTSVLEPEQVGWDWFSIQLDDGRDLMLFQLRRQDGSIDPRSSGTLIERDGRPRHIDENALALTPGRRWRSAATGARYPVEWRVTVASGDFDLRVAAALDNQELHTERSTGVNYWEGAVDVDGTAAGRPVRGRGYLEMTGYSGPAMGNILR